MTWPVRNLPVLQNWDCQGCSNCCREYRVYLTDEERKWLENLDWTDEANLRGVQAVVREGDRYRLNQRADGSCVFLSGQGRCRIHERFGSAAKPWPCRLYPFILIPDNGHWRVGLRYACPTAAKNQGKPIAEHDGELREFAAELQRQEGGQTRQPPLLKPGQVVAWPDVLAFVGAIQAILRDRQFTLERRWRKCLALAAICREAKFDDVKGERLVEFLDLVTGGIDADVPGEPAELAPPSWVGRVLFRQTLAVLVRKDIGPGRGPALRSRLSRLAAAFHFARGSGTIPRLHEWIRDVKFQVGEAPLGPFSPAADEALERYYLAKVHSLQFCGSANFGVPLWSGLDSLALTLPVILWLRRVLAPLPTEEAIVRALQIVDHNFGYSPHLGKRVQHFSLNILSQLGEIPRLIAWYSR